MIKHQFTPDTTFPIQLTDRLWVVGNYYFNLYLVRGDTATALVETGLSSMVDAVIAQLEGLKATPDVLVITHPHSDHLTGLPGLTDRYPEARIIAGAGAREFADHPKAALALAAEDRFMARALAERGIRPGRPPVDTVGIPDHALVVEQHREIDLGGTRIVCMASRGHSPGGILAWIPEDNAVLVADAMGFHFPNHCFLPLFFTDFQEYLGTLEKIISLGPDIVGPGHQGPLTGAEAREGLARALKATEDIKQRIIDDRRSAETVAEDLFAEYYRDEFTLYSEANIMGCCRLLVKRVRDVREQR
jgi:2-aminobenzoylacetyl-CoA thioesterase